MTNSDYFRGRNAYEQRAMGCGCLVLILIVPLAILLAVIAGWLGLFR